MASFTICQAARNPKETMIKTVTNTSQKPKTKPKRRGEKTIPIASRHLQTTQGKKPTKTSTNACPTRVHVFFQKTSAHSLQQRDGYAS
jgi:hypothetical protein